MTTSPRSTFPQATADRAAAGGRQFVLVTGMPRSGTTAVGSVLASADRTSYFYEPLNPRSGLRSIDDWFQFPEPGGASPEVQGLIDEVLRITLRLKPGHWDADSTLRLALKSVSGSRTRLSALRCRLDPRLRHVVWKDPFAAFLVPELAADHAMPAIITVRPPEATAASFKRLGWGFDLDRVRGHLERLTPGAGYLDVDVPTTSWANTHSNAAVNGAILWQLLYGYLDEVLPMTPAVPGRAPVVWADTRAIIASPLPFYRHLFDEVGLPFGRSTIEHIEEAHRDRGRSTPQAGRAHDRKRNVNDANDYGLRTLTDHERTEVARITAYTQDRLERRFASR